MKKSSYLKVLAPTVALSMILAACSGSDDKAGDKKETKGTVKQEITALESAEIPSMDSVMAQDVVSFTMLNNTNEGLYRLDKDQKAVPAMAEGPAQASDDGLTYTVKLRDAKWSNGDPVTAQDFVFAWQRAADPATASPYGPYMMSGKILNADKIAAKKAKPEELGIKAIDDKTLEIKLVKPIQYFESLMTFGTFLPQNKKFVESEGKDYASGSDNLLSNGPFKITGWDGAEDVDWTLEKNKDYWDADSVAMEKINFNVQKEPQSSLNMFQAGEADITPKLSQAGVIAQVESDPQLVRWLEPSIFWLKLNEKNKALANVNIRRAITMAIDKDALVNDVLKDGSRAANYFVPAEFVKDEKGQDFRAKYEGFNKYNVEEAKKLWAQGLKEIGQKEVTFTYIGQDTDTAKLSDAYFKDQLEKNLPGIKINLKNVPFAQKLKLETALDYDILFSGWGPDYQDPMTFSDLYITDGQNNNMAYSSKKYDNYIAEANKETDNAKYYSLLQDAEKTLLDEDAALVPLYQRTSNVLVSDKVKGFVYHTFGPEYTYKWLKVEK
ncbi:peptide ABC transporter substrate-binding protein [Cytobacillus sp. Hz8]|uniref:peptide ABC transporter substrate-binding protein n=1 Tax=Cytobacillus sp. Hz8 TaxID=3347168 RepID=UPI0035D75BD3